MPRYRLSELAEQDLESILIWTQEQFGEVGRLRYEALLVQAILDVADDPDRAGCQARPELTPEAATYHLAFSRNRVSKSIGRVKQPRHFLLYRMTDDHSLEIARILHDSMDLARHLPPGFQPLETDVETSI